LSFKPDIENNAIKSSQVKFIVSIAEYRELLNYTIQNYAMEYTPQNYTIKSTTKYTKRKRRTALLIQSIDNLAENTELKM